MLLLTVACDGLLEATRVIAPSSALIYVTHGLRLSIAHPCPCTHVKALAAAAMRDTAAKTRGGGRAILPRPPARARKSQKMKMFDDFDVNDGSVDVGRENVLNGRTRGPRTQARGTRSFPPFEN